MAKRPILASDILRQTSPRKMIGNNPNPFHVLREKSPAPDQASSHDSAPAPLPTQKAIHNIRSRSASIKRKNSAEHDFSESSSQISIPAIQLLPAPDGQNAKEQAEKLNVNLAKVNSIIEKVKSEVVEKSCDPVVISGFSSICEAIQLLSENQASIVELQSTSPSTTGSWAPQTRSYAATAA
jgi:hypothetical protein